MSRPANALQLKLPEKLADIASGLRAVHSEIEVTENRDGSVGLNLTASMEATLKIRPTKGGIEQLQVRPFQRVLHMLINMLWVAGVPIRLIILKSRQLGVTTDVQGILHDLTRRFPGISARTIAHTRPFARKIHGMQRRFYYYCPDQYKREIETGRVNRDRLKYALPHDSEIEVYSASGGEIRSDTVQLDHLTEVAFWPNASDTLYELGPSIHPIAHTMQIIESTANGKNFFYKLWTDAHDEDSVWIPIFISWLEDPAAWIPFISEAEKERFVASYTDEERKYATRWSLEPERIRWVRKTVNDTCRGSWDKFNQEYPIDPSVAFLFTGWPWFSTEIMANLLKPERIRPVAFRGDIKWVGNSIRTKLEEGDYGPLTLWEKEVDPSAMYSLGVDVAEGVGADYSECVIIKNEGEHGGPEVVGQYRANDEFRGKPGLLGLRSMQLGAMFNWGLLGVENNSAGHTTLEVCQRGMPGYPQLTRYPNLYYDIRKDKRTLQESEVAGWRTGTRSKRQMLSNLSESILNEDWEIHSMPLLNQMNNFTWDPRRKAWGMGYQDEVSKLANDDGIIALAIANEMRAITENRLIAEGLKIKYAGY